jgi:hypothetical protein
MKDTRETRYCPDSGKTEENTKPRFKPGDKVLIPHNGKLIEQIPRSVMWDQEFGGYLLFCHLIGVHEQNYIHESEKDQWISHEDGLWSWWERKGE